ncbi:MAG: hypothetical protein JNK81_05390 [Anaerolineales bacterium]|nr:hypothetical protein [Anaerolineales bacterium]
MTKIESKIFISKSIEDVFSFLSKRESHLRFIPRMISLSQTSQGDFAQVGGTSEGMLNYFGIKIPVGYEITENVANQKLSMNGKMPYVNFKDGYVLNKKDNGTEITFWLDLTPFGYTKIFSPFAWLIGKVHAWETLRNLQKEINRARQPRPYN